MPRIFQLLEELRAHFATPAPTHAGAKSSLAAAQELVELSRHIEPEFSEEEEGLLER